MKIKYLLRWIYGATIHLFRETYKAEICRHKTKKKGFITHFGETTFINMPLHKVSGNPDYCLDCIAEMTIVCAWCKRPITIGSPISLAIPVDPNHKIPEHAVEFEGYRVGCIRSSCNEGWMDISGFWVPPGKVERASPIVARVI